MNGIFILDKPKGLSSQQAVTKVKKILGAKKAGHGGTLDPDATGVLPIYLDQATRLAEYVLSGEKEYLAQATFGFATDTQDATGQVIEVGDPSQLTVQRVSEVLSQFVGTFSQIPPQFSALKIDGKPAYAWARQGMEVDLKSRLITIDEIRIESIVLNQTAYQVRFHVACSKGTYIRTLCHDLGKKLGVPAHMSALQRTKSGPFSIAQAHSIASVQENGWQVVLPPEMGIESLPKVHFDTELTKKIFHGVAVFISISHDQHTMSKLHDAEIVRVHDLNEQLIAICVVHIHMTDMIEFRPQKVFSNAEVDF